MHGYTTTLAAAHPTDECAPCEPPFRELLQKLERNNVLLSDITHNIACALDRLLGCVPEASCQSDKQLNGGGVLETGLTLASQYEASLGRLQEQMGRLNRAV